MPSMTQLRNLSAKSSPARRLFELNPFRIFRLSASVSTNEAVGLAESAMTLDRVGLPLDDPDPMPWLPPPTSHEMQQAAQVIEEPLARLQRQMAWFDFEHVPAPDSLRAALANPFGKEMAACLGEVIDLPKMDALVSAGESQLAGLETSVTLPVEKNPVCPNCGQPGALGRSRCRNCSTAYELIDVGDTSAPADDQSQTDAGISVPLAVPFWGTIFGGTMTLTVTVSEPCPACLGTGTSPTETMPCPACGSDPKRRQTCFRCAGAGVTGVPCTECRKSGVERHERQVRIPIPPRVSSGTLLRLRGQGNSRGEGKPPGDLYVAVEIAPDDYFTRVGNDIITTMTLNAVEVARGETLDVATLGGIVHVQLPLKTANGDVLRLRGRGMLDRSRRRGDHYIRVALTATDSTSYRQATEAAAAEIARLGPASDDPFEHAAEEAAKKTTTIHPEESSVVAQVLNQSNLRLLSATVRMDASMEGAASYRTAAPKALPQPDSWARNGAFTVLQDAHSLITNQSSGTDDAETVAVLWSAALKDWMRLLSHPWFHGYVESAIDALQDDFATADDVETVHESVRNQFLDLSVQQARFLVLEGRYPLSGAIIAALDSADIDSRLLTPAMRPLRSVFQSELSELEPLLIGSGEAVIEPVETYFRQLEPIYVRWRQLDPKGIVGLTDLLDDAVEKGFLRLRTIEDASPRAEELIPLALKLTTARSLIERLELFQKELEQRRKNVCYYCRTAKPTWEKYVVLSGKKETGRTRNFNRTTIHYQTTKDIVPRCDNCADRHDYIRKTVRHIWIAGVVSLFLVAMVFAALPGPPPPPYTPSTYTPDTPSTDNGSSSTPSTEAPADPSDSSDSSGQSSSSGSALDFVPSTRMSGHCVFTFSESSFDLSDEAKACLNRVNTEMKNSPNLLLAIVGHRTADETDDIAKKRVFNTADYLVDVPDNRMTLLLGSRTSAKVETFYIIKKSPKKK